MKIRLNLSGLKLPFFSSPYRLIRLAAWLLIISLVVWAASIFVGRVYEKRQINKVIREYAAKYDVDFKLARDIASAESSLRPRAHSRDGGVGLYQFMPKTWGWATAKLYGEPLAFSEAYDLRKNAEVGVWFISWIEKTLRKEGAYSKAAVIYSFNAGIGKLRGKKYQLPPGHKNRVYDEYFRKHTDLMDSSKPQEPE